MTHSIDRSPDRLVVLSIVPSAPQPDLVVPTALIEEKTLELLGGNAEFGQNSTLRLKAFSCIACKEVS
jgi:hypothetical protein